MEKPVTITHPADAIVLSEIGSRAKRETKVGEVGAVMHCQPSALVLVDFHDILARTRFSLGRQSVKARSVSLSLPGPIMGIAVLFALLLNPHWASASAGAREVLRLTSGTVVRPVEGWLDLSFDPGTGADEGIDAVALQDDAKILIGGTFAHYDGAPRRNIARINPDGSVDASFDPGEGPNLGSRVYAIAVQPDGKIVIGGNFSTYQKIPRNGVARLNADGSLDTSFLPGEGVNGGVLAIALQSNGKMLIGGSFYEVNSTPRNNIARLNADGSLDTTFDPGEGADNRVHSLAIQPSDGKVLIGGYFNAFNGQVRHHLARLETNGILDTTFDPGDVANEWAIVYSIVVQPNGKILVGGSFSEYRGISREGIARANPDGSIDTTFDPGRGTNDAVHALVLQPDGRVLLAGAFQSYNTTIRLYVARSTSSGALDSSFDPGQGTDQLINAMVRQLDGKVVIAGTFTKYDNVVRNCIARVNAQAHQIYLPVVLRRP